MAFKPCIFNSSQGQEWSVALSSNNKIFLFANAGVDLIHPFNEDLHIIWKFWQRVAIILKACVKVWCDKAQW